MASHDSHPGVPNWLINLFTYGIGFALAGAVLFWASVFMAGVVTHSRPKAEQTLVEQTAASAVTSSSMVEAGQTSASTPAPTVSAVVDEAAPTSKAELPPHYEEGQVIYTTICGVCHQPTGLGLPNMFPPLAGSDWVKAASPARLIRILLHGFQGPIQINGKIFTTPAPMMPPQGALPDEKIAAVLTYIRQNWENGAAPVTADQIKAVRESERSRVAMWTEEELLKVPLEESTP